MIKKKLVSFKKKLVSFVDLVDNRYIRPYLLAQGVGKWKTLIPEEEFSNALSYGITKLMERLPKEKIGDYLEFGVSRGTSMATAYRVLKTHRLDQIRLIGFDSFQGMPAEAAGQGWNPGQFWSTIGATRRYLAQHGVPKERFTLIKGWFNDTLTIDTYKHFNLNKASIIMVDCDIYSASKQALVFSASLIHDSAIIIFDDWGWQSDKNEIGQKEAFEEFLNEFSYFTAESLPGYIPQSRIFLVSRSRLPEV